MFQLEEAIKKWRADCERSDSMSPDTLAELETHLRDSVDRLGRTGLSTEETFLVALHRLGAPDELHVEFNKVHGDRAWLGRVALALSGYLGISLALKLIALDQAAAGLIGLVLGWESAGAPAGHGFSPHWSALLNVSIGLAGTGLLIWILASLAKGPGRSFLKGSPDAERRMFQSLEGTPRSVGKLAVWWLVLYLGASVTQVAFNVVSYRMVTPEAYGDYALSLSLYNPGFHFVTMSALALVTMFLWRSLRRQADAS